MIGEEDMIGMMLLTEMKKGETAVVCEIKASGFLRERLIALGMVVGTRVRCERVGLSGGMAVYLVRGARLAIRKCDGKQIVVCRVHEVR